MKVLGLFLLSALHLASASSEDLTLFSVNDCVGGFTAMQFSFGRFDKYNEYFRDDSTMVLAQTGIYQGAEDIAEYVNFAFGGYWDAPTSPFPPRFELKPQTFDPVNGSCEFIVATLSSYEVDGSRAGYSSEYTVANLAKIRYDIANNYIESVNVYYTDPFLEFIFGHLLNSKATEDFVCDAVLNGSCGYDVDKCQRDVRALPAATYVDGSPYVDGDSLGCRALHSIFALNNGMNHCAHVSLTPLADPKGRFKCQTSQEIPVSELFDEWDLNILAEEAVKGDIDPEIGFIETCDRACVNSNGNSNHGNN